MRKIFIVLTFIFISLLGFADNTNITMTTLSDEQTIELDFNVKLLLGMIKAENNPKYKKLLDYIDENLDKKGEVKYSYKINIDRKVVEFFSEKGDILLTENLPKEFLDIVDRSIRVAENKEEIKKTIKNIYEDPYTNVTISKYKESLILFTEENMVNRSRIKNIMSVVLKR